MPKRRRSLIARRSRLQVAADAHADRLADTLGRSLKDGRRQLDRTQAQVAHAAGVAPSTVSQAERGHGADYTMRTWSRLSSASGSDLRAYLARTSAASQPRDIVHLGNQELVIRAAASGGWGARPEVAIGDAARGAWSIDVLLGRADELAVMEIFDWFEDVGAAVRSWDRKLARTEASAIARMPPPLATGRPERLPRVSGCWIVRATQRNRGLLTAHGGLFRARFPGPAGTWLRALRDRGTAMPEEPGLLWVAVDGTRIWPSRLGRAS